MPRLHFDYFVPAILTTFIIMSGAWMDSFQISVKSTGVAAAGPFYVLAPPPSAE